MSRQFFVGGNFKMNPASKAEVTKLLDGLLGASIDSSTEVVVAPPALYLETALQQLKSSAIKVAAQNCYSEEKGAFTGEISPHMLADAGIPWVIIGHSERRTLFNDLSALVAKKTQAAISQGLSVILCIGETLEERENGQTMARCEEQLKAVIDIVDEKDWAKIVIAYEPVWAIGTGKVATPEQAQEVHADLRAYMKTNVSAPVADAVRIIYGGSANGSNCKSLAEKADIDGFLVGGASLKPEFSTICNATQA